MPFAIGSAADINELRTALINTCVANGWTLNGEVLSKGTAFVRLQIVGSSLELLGGTGIDAGNLLLGGGPRVVLIGQWGGFSITYPATWEIYVHSAPDEVYLVVNYNATDYQWCAFGLGDVQGLPGTGMWYGASIRGGGTSNVILIGPSGIVDGLNPFNNKNPTPVLFGSNDWLTRASHVHHGFDGGAWDNGFQDDGVDGAQINALTSIYPLYARQPNADGDAVLLPLRVHIARPGFRSSLALEIAHSRLVRIDNFEPRDLITLGPDQWRVYPWFRKSVTARDGGQVTHSGTMGWAIRFDGVP